MNELVNVAVAEKLDALRSRAFARDRASSADVEQAIALLGRIPADPPPLPGEEMPEDWER